MEELISKVRALVNTQTIPAKQQIEFATNKGVELANKLGANEKIVELGTLLMDCMLGEAYKQNKASEHAKMSLEKANEFLDGASLSEDDKENIRHCILEHHGVEKFYSLESEICCNADCYKFTSIEGFLISFRYTREIPFGDIIKLFNEKVEEKWNAITLDIVKKELEPQHQIILKILGGLK